MNPLHENILDRFLAGETAVAIGLTIGYSAQRVRNVLRAKQVGDMRRYGRPKRRHEFQSRPDGEYCRCEHCTRLGYGADAWHPATSEFWRMTDGRLHLSQCKACLADVAERKKGVVRVAA